MNDLQLKNLFEDVKNEIKIYDYSVSINVIVKRVVVMSSDNCFTSALFDILLQNGHTFSVYDNTLWIYD